MLLKDQNGNFIAPESDVEQHVTKKSQKYRYQSLKRRIRDLEMDLEESHQDAIEAHKKLGLAQEELAAHNAEMTRILQSNSWKFVQKLTFAVQKLLPSGSIRAKIFEITLLRPLKRLIDKRRQRKEEKDFQFDKQEPLVFPVHKKPMVSIIIPVYNQLRYTWGCLQSILATGGQVSYEIILADDKSTDQTKRIGEKVENIRIVRNVDNLRFLRNCNHAATYAKGDFILFLNNDTKVHENWLQSLLQLAHTDETIGVVGSKLLFADGKLQEAGGILWEDGSAWNYGRGDNADKPEYCYVKETDYVSGCSLMVRADLWRELGGFDERYVPAYCEDSDLCFEARKRGYKVMYQPFSVVTHFEGVSNGTDLSEGFKKYQVENSKKFFEKWKKELQINHYANGQHVLRARDRTKNNKRLLVVDHYVPAYDQDAGNRTMHEFVKLFKQEGYHVVLLPNNFSWTEKYTPAYQQMGVEVLYGAWYAQNWEKWLVESGSEFDTVLLSRPHIAKKYMDAMRQNTNAKILFYGHDLHFLREIRQYELTHDELLLDSINEWYRIELNLINQADFSFYPSIIEVQMIQKEKPEARVGEIPAFIFSNIDKRPYRLDGRKDLLFVGSFGHVPNEDAILWFVYDIWPRLQQAIPELHFHIVGNKPPSEIQKLDSSNIQVHGFVSDEELKRLYTTCRLNIVPLRFGAGIKGKVVESLAYGLPVITTLVGAEGITNAKNYMAVADTQDAFAEAVLALYNDEEKLATLVTAGYEYVEKTFSPDAVMKVFNEAIQM